MFWRHFGDLEVSKLFCRFWKYFSHFKIFQYFSHFKIFESSFIILEICLVISEDFREYFCDIRSFESILVILTILMALQRFWQFIRYIFVILKVSVLFSMKMFHPRKRAFFLINRNLFSIWEYFPIALNAR